MGTMGFFSEEMAAGQFNQNMYVVDLYYNDVHCLKIALNEL